MMERRKKRMEERFQALELQFAAMHEAGAALHIALADVDGMLLGHAGEIRTCEALAHQAVADYRSTPVTSGESWRFEGDVATAELSDGRWKLFLALKAPEIELAKMNALVDSVGRIMRAA